MVGPFSSPPFSTFRINPIGIATRKYSGKKRLIIDLSAPHGSSVPSVNSLVPSDEFSLCYARVDDAISLIKLVGRGTWMAKADIVSAFKVLPIHPDFWHLFCVRWKGRYYFATRLVFGCKSSPKIFDCFAEALSWILLNVCHIPYVVHLLDDFLVLDAPSSPPARCITSLESVFHRLGVPLSAEKTVGPSTSLEFLGILLDSAKFQASLPRDKQTRISQVLSEFLQQPRCTKQQLLSLLGHLNFAMRIIPQGRAFISHLLLLASSATSYFQFVTLDEACLAEIRFWLLLLSHWNGISFFFNDAVSNPVDIHLFTDAAPSTGFGGFYDGRWFASQWPAEFFQLPSDLRDSSALRELYPIIVAALLWGHEWTRRVIFTHSDNLAVVNAINKGRSNSLSLMPLLQRLTWHSIMHQFILKAVHIPGSSNSIADSLSRFQFQKFRTLAPLSDPHPTPVPPYLDTIFPLHTPSTI
ncbi:uncharacterized protein LOC125799168 [Astyanax mexicanus]|uniref:uncharacterized protein LOC125799168 n=1 Tax=Astyanax mexicanus TaxID=7994 RepID=UPI0020CACE9D|nr:uncharacterized protein LOC125799168 [Astyanax mexicanus]